MNRVITQIGQSIYEWFFTKPAQDNMVALGKLAGAVFGTSPIANGLTCTPTAPASLQVTIGAGEIYALAPLEATAYGTLPADTTHQIIKQGISLDPVLVSCAPPPTGGQAINYLIQVQYQDLDVSLDPTTGSAAPVVLQFYNSSNPSQPWQGPNNNGQTSNTFRNGVVAVQAKAGIAATTGSQVTPAPDAGWTGLSVVTVANGQTTITAGNITPYAGAPILSETLPQKISQATADGRYAAFANLLGASSIPPISVATTLTASAAGRHHVFSAGVPATLPAASSLTAGQAISFHSLVSGASIVRAGTDVITTGNGTPTSISMNAGDTLTLMSNGSSGWYPVDGSMQLQFAAVMRSVTSLGVGAGYRQFPAYPGDPTPLLVQWGATASPSAANTESTTTFQTAFPNECSTIVLTDFATLSNVGVIWTVSAKTPGNFKAYWGAGATAPGSTNARTAMFIAFGR